MKKKDVIQEKEAGLTAPGARITLEMLEAMDDPLEDPSSGAVLGQAMMMLLKDAVQNRTGTEKELLAAFCNDVIISSMTHAQNYFNKLLTLLGSCSYSEQFKRNFEELPPGIRFFIFKEFQLAIKRGAQTRFYPDNEIIKDVTPDDESEIKVYALKINSPAFSVRVYFYETRTKIFLGNIESKSRKKEKKHKIRTAGSIIKQLLLLEN